VVQHHFGAFGDIPMFKMLTIDCLNLLQD